MQTEITTEKARELILENTAIKENFEYIPIEKALDKVCFRDVEAKRNAPTFSNSSMDGYALSFNSANKTLPIIGTIFAGDQKEYTLQDNQCYKIMTGAMLPKNCDCVVPFEEGINPSDENVTIPNDLTKNQNCRLIGEEFQQDRALITKGELLTPQHISLLASQGIMYIAVYASLKIAIVSSGDEIIEPWQEVDEHQIYNSNTITLKSLLQKYGFEADYKGVFPDNLQKSIEFIDTLKDYDVIISTGGVSMGEADFVSEAFVKNEMKAIFHKIKIKPGRPMLYGKMGKTSVFALPGNPMSSFLMGLNFIIPALFKAIGSKNIFFNPTKAINKNDFRLARNKVTVVLGELRGDSFEAIDKNKYNSGMISPLTRANAIALFGEEKNNANANEELKVINFYSSLIDLKLDTINE